MNVSFKMDRQFQKTEEFLNFKKRRSKHLVEKLQKYGEIGVEALSKATPVRTGKTASSWGYRIIENERGYLIFWYNTNVVKYVNIAVILQTGHVTGGKKNRGYARGVDYINPALRSVFEDIADKAWEEVNKV